MQIDLFAEIDTLQRSCLLRLQRASSTTDFTDRHEVSQLQEELRATSHMLGRCMTFESLYVHPLLAGTGPQGFGLGGLHYHLRGQLNLLADRLDSICDHVQRLNPSWRAALIMEGRAFQQKTNNLVKTYMRHVHLRYTAMMAIRDRQSAEKIAEAHWHLAGALLLLKHTQSDAAPPQSPNRRPTAIRRRRSQNSSLQAAS